MVSFNLELLPCTLDMPQSLKNQSVFIHKAVIFLSLSALAKDENGVFNLAGQFLRYLISSDLNCISQD